MVDSRDHPSSQAKQAANGLVEQARKVPIEDEIKRRGIQLKRNSHDLVGPCPRCGGTDRFAINPKKRVFNCRGCKVGGDVITLVQHLDGVDFLTAVGTLVGAPLAKPNDSATKPRKIVVATFPYEDIDGSVVFVTERMQWKQWDGSWLYKGDKPQKTFRQKRPDGNGWIFNIDGVPPLPYRLPELIEALGEERIVLVVEGEAKVDLLRSWNVPATCCSGGAGNAGKWTVALCEHLRGADVVLVPDNDDPGYHLIAAIGAALAGVAKRVRVLRLPGLPHTGDIIDWAAAGGTREALDALIEQAPDWQPATAKAEVKAQATADETALIEALAKLPPGVAFARERKSAAKKLHVPVGAIDAEIARTREDKEVAPLHVYWIVEPWPEAVEGDSLLRDLMRRVQRHVVCAHDDALTIALWIMLAWVHDDVAIHSPILAITSAEPECGKTTLIGLLAFLLPRCITSVDISEAALYRSIERWQPSFAIDEFDKALVSDEKAGLVSVINSGHVKGQGVIRCIGEDRTPQLFTTFSPKALGMIGRRLPDATRTRCITVELLRKKRTDWADKLQHADDAGLCELQQRLLRWASDNADALRTAEPSMPPGFENRVADNWSLQFRIADLCGEDWGDKARAAAMGIERKTDNRTSGAQLLADIKMLFDTEPAAKCMLSAMMVAKLTEDADKPWAEISRGRPLTQNRLAKMLDEYHIKSQVVWPTPERSGRGYYRHQFTDAWERYLPDNLSASADNISS